MKNTKLLLVLLIVSSAVILPSCKKKNDPAPAAPSPAPTSTASFSAKIDGVSTTFAGSYYQAISGGIYVQGGGATAPYIQLATQLSQATGTYTIGSTGVQMDYVDASGTGHFASTGTLTISSLANNKISGTFSFVENGGVTITNGVFTDIPKQ